MRRRPDEDDREEEQRRDPDVPGRRGPADERRHGARGAADHDVLRRRALQPARVDDDVEEAADEREDRGEDVDRAREQNEGERQQREPELERPARGTRPDATGRAFVRSPISGSMSRSSTWLSADAPPQASARPDHRGNARPVPGQPRAPAIIPQKPVISRSDMIRGFVSAT